MGWTKARLLAYCGDWYPDILDHNGPACYEIGTGGPRGGYLQWHYVGETVNEKIRLATYARSGSHLAEAIQEHLDDGWHIFYRACACPTKGAAKKMQDSLLAKHKYDWNKVGNG